MFLELFLVFHHGIRHFLKFLFKRFYFCVVLSCEGVLFLFGLGQLQFQVEQCALKFLDWGLMLREVSAAGAVVMVVKFVLGVVFFLLDKLSDFILEGILILLEEVYFVVEFLDFHFELIESIEGVDEFNLFGVEFGLDFFDVDFVFGDFVVFPFDLVFGLGELLAELLVLVFEGE